MLCLSLYLGLGHLVMGQTEVAAVLRALTLDGDNRL